MKAIAQQNDTLDLICWRELGQTETVVEQAYALNHDLADHGPLLADGTIVTLPDALPATPSVSGLVQLWD